MEVFLAVVLCIVIVSLSNWWDRKKESREMSVRSSETDPNADLYTKAKEEMERDKQLENGIGTRDLFLETLTKIGCQYELAEEEGDNRIFFAYQGEHFAAEAINGGLYVHVWDMFWAEIELYDIDEFSRLRKAINNANLSCATTTIYTVNDASSTVDVHCKSTFLFFAQIPELDSYLCGELNDFFRAHQLVSNEMAKLREQEVAK